jgi:serine/threonine-protein kinase RsbW
MNEATASTVVLRMPAKAEYLVLARLALSGLAHTIELDPEVLADLKLAVTEACANAARHAYEDEGRVTLRLGADEGEVRIEIEDEGAGFGFAGIHAEPEPELLPEDGMGLAIIRAVVDELQVGSGEGGRGTKLQLLKRL